MERQYRWMEESLRRTSEQAKEVLERARRREEDWWDTHRHEAMRSGHGTGGNEDDGSSVMLEEAFTTMSEFMLHTTEQCKAYHSCLPPRGINEQEKQHIDRFHHRRPPRGPQRPESPLSSHSGPLRHSGMKRTDPRDVYIEVAPGTYCISAGSQDCPAQTRIVNITPGRSVDLTFHI